MHNYFSILGLPEKYDLSFEEIDKMYYQQMSKYTVETKDNFEKMNVLNKLSDINKAYNVIKNELTRVQHFLELKGFNVLQMNLSKDKLSEIINLSEQCEIMKSDNKICIFLEIQNKKISLLKQLMYAELSNHKYENSSYTLLEIVFIINIK